ncbi:MAG: signal peptidase I [Lachnospiraceae bacterium]|nr:signal peptidase I [Lachnospiraceae bacterium]
MTDKEKRRDLIEWIMVFVIAIGAAVILNGFIVVNARIPSASMENTIMIGDRVFGNRLIYNKEDPMRGDIVIFKFPDDESQLFIKRIIGLPGDTVVIKDGKVYLNDDETALDESSYINGEPYGDFGPFEVPENAYFVMGDNRNNSYDARYWNNTFVYRDKILGKAFVRYFPNPSFIK